MRILVTDGMDKTAMAELKAQGHEVVEQFYESEELGKALRDFDVVVVRSKTKVRAPHIDEAKGSNLKLIIRGGVGVDNIDVKYAEENGIMVRNTPNASSQSVAECALAHMFACARFISIAGAAMRNDIWDKKAYSKGIELQGKTLGIIGFGRIGAHLGVMAKAIGMNVVATRSSRTSGTDEATGIPYVTLDELLEKSDFISLHAPALPGGPLVNADTIAKTVACAVARDYEVTLVYAFEKRGVLSNPADDNSVIPTITRADFDRYVADGVIAGGMIPKVENALAAIDEGVARVVITQADAIDGQQGTIIR